MGETPVAQRPGNQNPVRLDVRRLAQLVFYALLLPGGLGILFDLWLGLFPLLTLGVMVLVFPLAAFYILRGALREMNNVIAQVAPEPEETEEPETEAGASHPSAAGSANLARSDADERGTDEEVLLAGDRSPGAESVVNTNLQPGSKIRHD